MTTEKDSAYLEQIGEKVRSRMNGKTQVFPIYGFPEERVIDWDGNEIDDFLDLCEKCSVSLVYICEFRPKQINADDDEFFSDRLNQLGQIEIAFLHDGFFHRFKEVTDWWKIYWDGQQDDSPFGTQRLKLSKEQAAEIGECILRLREGEITDDFIKEFRESDHPDFTFTNRLYRYMVKKYGLTSSDLYDFHTVNEEAADSFTDFSKSVEKVVVDSVLPSLIEWARNNTSGKLLKADTEVFLSENRLKLSKESVNALWRKGSYGLKQAGM